jgi:peroxiredoxin
MRLFLTLALVFLFASSSFSQSIASQPTEVTPLLISEKIPDVSVRDLDNKPVHLRELVAQQPTMLVFYRGGWCPYCSRHLAELNQIQDEILALGWKIVAISVDRPEILRKTLTKSELKYTLLSDSPANAIKAFGLAFKVPQETIDQYKTIGIDLEGDSGQKHHILPAPAVYLVGTDGIVKFQYVNPNYRERIAGEVLLAAAKAYL